MMYGVLAVVLFCVFLPAVTYCQVCGGHGIGTGLVDRSSNGVNAKALLLVKKGIIDCHGLVQEWKYYQAQSICDNVAFQVWRQTFPLTDDYMLIGENIYTTCPQNGVGTTTFQVPVQNQIPVRPEDILGLRHIQSSNGMIKYDDSTGGARKNGEVRYLQISNNVCKFAVGKTCKFPKLQTYYRDYSLMATVNKAEPPRFDNLKNTAKVYEDAGVGTLVFSVKASHRRTWIATVGPTLTYDLFPTPRPTFTITNTGEIETAAYLDYETVKTYPIRVRVSDGAQEVTDILTVEVLDVNEPHHVTNVPSTKTISAQTTGVNQEIFKVTLSDPDKNVNFPIKRFNLVRGHPDVNLFQMDLTTGSVRCTQDLKKWKGANVYKLDIMVTDGVHVDGPRQLTVVIDGMRKEPWLNNLPTTITLNEDVQSSFTVYQAKVNRDKYFLGRHTFQIIRVVPGAESGKFSIDKQSGRISVANNQPFPVFDFVKTNKYNIEVSAADDLYSAAAQNLTVDIQWRNRAPKFSSRTYTLSIQEEQRPLTPVPLVATTTDRDINIVGKDSLGFNILNSKWSHFFTVTTVNNKISVKIQQQIDTDDNVQNRKMRIPLQVLDQHGGTDTSDLLLTVTDINDNSPLFHPVTYATKMYENATGGEFIVAVKATDKDYTSPNKDFTFAIDESNRNSRDVISGREYFQVHPQTGVVTLKHPMDFHDYETYGFEVIARDGGRPTLTGTAQVTVTIIDINNHRPHFTKHFHNLHVRSDTLVHHEIARVTAIDKDGPNVSHVSYFFLLPEEHLEIRTDNGSVLVRRNLWPDHKYILYCYARDNGDPELLSDPTILRIDSYSGWKYLIDITLQLPLGEFNKTLQERFRLKLAKLLSPWDIVIERVTLDQDNSNMPRTKVTFLALHDRETDFIENLEVPKRFVWRNDILGRTRTDIHGTPNEALRSREFDEFQPIKVMPAFPIWMLDTVEGIVTLSLLCLLGLIILVLITLFLMKKFKCLCFKQRPPEKSIKRNQVDHMMVHVQQNKQNRIYQEEFRFSYGTNKMPHTPNISGTVTNEKKEIIPPVLVPDRTRPVRRRSTNLT